jgi:tetratricopeptide (TPR) repeat protein
MDKAESLYVRALATRERLQPGHAKLSGPLIGLSMIYGQAADYDRAEKLAQRAIVVLEKTLGSEHPSTARALNQLGRVYLDTGRAAQATLMFQRAIAVAERTYGAESLRTANYQGNLAITYDLDGNYPKAEVQFQRVLATYTKIVGPQHPDTAVWVNNLAVVKGAVGAVDEAVALFEQALVINRAVHGEEHPVTAEAFRAAAETLRTKSDFERAQLYFRRALAIYRKLQLRDNYDTAKALAGLGMLRWKMRQPAEALAMLQRAQAIHFAIDERVFLNGTESRSQDYLQVKSFDAARDVSFSVGVRNRESASLGLTRVLNYKARILNISLDGASRLRRSLSKEDRALLEELAEVASRVSQFAYADAAQLSPRARQQLFAELSRRQRELEARLGQRSSESRREAAPVTVARLNAALPDNAALVEWFRYEPHNLYYQRAKDEVLPARYVAYVLRRGQSPETIDVGPAASIERLAQEFRLTVSEPGRVDVRQRAAALSDLVLRPVLGYLNGVRHLILSPDGALNLVPMAALLDERGRYLIERFEITHVTSGRDLLRLGNSERVLSSNPVVIANPEFGSRLQLGEVVASQRSEELDRGGLVFRELPGSAQEASSVARLLQHERVRCCCGERLRKPASNNSMVRGSCTWPGTGSFSMTRTRAAWYCAQQHSRIPCCALGSRSPALMHAAPVSARTVFSRPLRPRNSTCAAPNRLCSPLAKRGWARFATASALSACGVVCCWPARRVW